MTDDKVTITLAAKTTDPNVLRLAAGDVGRMQLGFNGLPESLPSTLNALADALDQAGDMTYEPTREFWTPYEPWMRDVLADDARMSWIGLDIEYRGTWSFLDLDNTGWNLDHKVRVHPDDVPEQPAEDDPDEALAKVVWDAFWIGTDIDAKWELNDERPDWLRVARAAREHIADDHQCPVDEGGWHCVLYRGHGGDHATEGAIPYDEMRARAEKAEAERDEWQDHAEKVETDRSRIVVERDEARAKHAALRADVASHRQDTTNNPCDDILDRDAAREPQS